MKATWYVGCTICGRPRDDEDVQRAFSDDARIPRHDHLWAEMQLVDGWHEEVGGEG